ncbi:hypothetical protein [Dongshaea marina]|uniref:hypothetical protein n=1 Tax=Dongshaea marina TaxID=2047966 RepID=UPI00131F1087|nr:hypothetical protein [Dongshaea marina]
MSRVKEDEIVNTRVICLLVVIVWLLGVWMVTSLSVDTDPATWHMLQQHLSHKVEDLSS